MKQFFLFALLAIGICVVVSAEITPPPNRLESSKYRYVGNINASAQYLVAKYLTGCIYIYRGNGKMILHRMQGRQTESSDSAMGFGFAITDYDFADRIFYDLKNKIIDINDVIKTDTCDDFYETHVKGTVSFGMTKNIFSAYQTFDDQLSRRGFMYYGVRPAENQWEIGALYTSGAMDLSKIMILFSSIAVCVLL